MAKNITEYKKLVQELKESNELNYNLIEQSPHPVLVADFNRTIVKINPALSKLTGYSNSECIGATVPFPWWMESESEEINRVAILTREAALENKGRKFIRKFKKKNGDVLWIEITPTAIVIDGKFKHFVVIWMDITDRKKREEDMKYYISELIKAHEDERRLIACELHDEDIPRIASLALKAQTLIRSKDQSNEAVFESLDELKIEAISITEQVRSFCHKLRPDILDQLGFASALEMLIAETRKNGGIEIDFDIVGAEQRLNSEMELGLFRIAQEALNNIVKHSRAKQASVVVAFNGEKMKLTIADAGKGFTGYENIGNFASGGKLGLIGMQERVDLLKGSLSIRSKVNSGTTVEVEIPVRACNAFEKYDENVEDLIQV